MVVSFEHYQGKLILTLREIRRSCNDGTQDVWCKETSFRGGARIMRIVQVFLVVLGVFLLSGCGDQFWCGEDGCGKRCTSQRCINSDDSLGL